MVNFIRLRDHNDYTEWLGLKAAYGMSVIQIETMYSDNETIYDQYLDVFQDVVNTFEAILSHIRRPFMRFGNDAGLICLGRWAARWCRDPPIRKRLISLMYTCYLQEDNEGSQIAAAGAEVLQHLEERDIKPAPMCCGDIPEHRRVRLHTTTVYRKNKSRRLDFLRYPYTGSVESIWMKYPDGDYQYQDSALTTTSETEPDTIFGPGYKAWRRPDGSYYTVRSPEFYFVLPKA